MNKLKWGYTVWTCGWLSLLVGIVLIVIGALSSEDFGLWRGGAGIITGLIWLISGSTIIKKYKEIHE